MSEERITPDPFRRNTQFVIPPRLNLSALWKETDCKNCGQRFEQRRTRRYTTCEQCRRGARR